MSRGAWLFWVSFVYFVVGTFDLFVYRFCPIEYIQVVYIVVLSLPLWVGPVSRKLGIKARISKVKE